jgi:23S rRNA (cytosine1962-C5)-methyltransferase
MDIKAGVVLKKNKDESLLRRHPWVFSGAINDITGNPASGDWVNIYDVNNKFLGAGHYQDANICVRILSFKPVTPDIEFWKTRIKSALEFRKNLGLFGNSNTNAYRLVYGEGDDLPGLIVDVYDKTAVMQAHSTGMYNDRKMIADALIQILNTSIDAVYFKDDNSKENKSGYLIGNIKTPAIVTENSHLFKVNWVEGQKTGFFIDQRDNRDLLSRYSRGKDVLNTFCYTGGFSVYALKAGANLVHSVDASKTAIDLTNENVSLNFPEATNHEAFAVDAFQFLEQCKNKYDLIVLDPPAFAKHRDAKHNAFKGYQRLNSIAIRNIRPNGIIFTFSCSQVVKRDLFYNTIVSAAIIAGRKVRVLHHLSQAPDHPVSVYHPEGEYLKGLVLFVE